MYSNRCYRLGTACESYYRHNTPLVCAFKEACFVDEEDFGFALTLENITKSGQHPAFEPVRKYLLQRGITHKPKITYSQLYVSPWQASFEDEVRHKELIYKMKKWVKPKRESIPDKVLAALGKCVLAFNTDFIDLQKRDFVEGLQMRCLGLLRNYLKMKYNGRPEASARFAEGLRMISYAREVVEIQKRRLPL